MLETLNYTAVVVATIAVFLFGWLWHGPLFGKQWMKATGIKVSDIKSPVGPMIKGLITTFVMVCALAILAVKTGYNTPKEAAVLGALAAIGLSATVHYGRVNWEGSNMTLFWIGTGYSVIGAAIAGAVYATLA